ncbi:MAG: hypothetical protein GY835_19135, partial [bacterium]|nr:hypothetical protein [bacterium]
MNKSSKQALRRFLWSAHPVRAIVEAWLWGFAILFLLWRLAGNVIPAVMGNGWFVLAGMAGMWAVLRARLAGGAWWQQGLEELGIGFALSVSMFVGIMGPVYLLHWESTWQIAFVDDFPVIALMWGIGPGF